MRDTTISTFEPVRLYGTKSKACMDAMLGGRLTHWEFVLRYRKG